MRTKKRDKKLDKKKLIRDDGNKVVAVEPLAGKPKAPRPRVSDR